MDRLVSIAVVDPWQELEAYPVTHRVRLVKAAVDTILRSHNEAANAQEREEIAKEINRLDPGGAKQALADLAEQALAEAKETA